MSEGRADSARHTYVRVTPDVPAELVVQKAEALVHAVSLGWWRTDDSDGSER